MANEADHEYIALEEFRKELHQTYLERGAVPPVADSPEEQKLFRRWQESRAKKDILADHDDALS